MSRTTAIAHAATIPHVDALLFQFVSASTAETKRTSLNSTTCLARVHLPVTGEYTSWSALTLPSRAHPRSSESVTVCSRPSRPRTMYSARGGVVELVMKIASQSCQPCQRFVDGSYANGRVHMPRPRSVSTCLVEHRKRDKKQQRHRGSTFRTTCKIPVRAPTLRPRSLERHERLRVGVRVLTQRESSCSYRHTSCRRLVSPKSSSTRRR